MRILKFSLAILLLHFSNVRAKILMKYICDPNPDIPNHICRNPYICRPEGKSIGLQVVQKFTVVRKKINHPYPEDLVCPPSFIQRDTSPGHIGAKLDSMICRMRKIAFEMFESLESGHSSLDRIMKMLRKCIRCSRPAVLAKIEDINVKYLNNFKNKTYQNLQESEHKKNESGDDKNNENGQKESGDDKKKDNNQKQSGEDNNNENGQKESGDDKKKDNNQKQSGDDKKTENNQKQSGEDKKNKKGRKESGVDKKKDNDHKRSFYKENLDDLYPVYEDPELDEDPKHLNCKVRKTKKQVRDDKLKEIANRVYVDINVLRFNEREEIAKKYHAKLSNMHSTDEAEFDRIFEEMRKKQHAVDMKFDKIEKKNKPTDEVDAFQIEQIYEKGRFKEEDYWTC